MSEPMQPFPEETDNSAEDFEQIEEVEISNENDSMRDVEDLTIAELIAVWLRSPAQTWRALMDIIRPDSYVTTRMIRVDNVTVSSGVQDERGLVERIRAIPMSRRWISFGLFVAALLIAFIGNTILHGSPDVRRSEEVQLAGGMPVLFFAMVVWLWAEIVLNWDRLTAWVDSLFRRSEKVAFEQDERVDNANYPLASPWYMTVHPLRMILAFFGMICSLIVWFGTSGNTYDTPTFYIWLLGIACWSFAFVPQGFDPFEWGTQLIERVWRFHWYKHLPVILALIVIMLVGAYFRFYDLHNHPLEMTDDHVELILDSSAIRSGYRPIFLANNGGREPMQMYFVAMLSYFPGFGLNHDTIKFLDSFESSFLTLPLLFFLGYELMEGESRRRRLLVGLLLSALVAVSYWDVAITRQGLRIPLTLIVVPLELIYLSRAIRHNSRADFIKAGLILGFGMYTYQAVRMLPVVIVIAVGVAVIFVAKTMRDRVRYILNLGVLVIVSFVIFVPMLRYSVEYPDLFWRRTAGRLLGDDLIQETAPDGSLVYRNATVDERIAAFKKNLPTLVNNIRNVFLMFNWEGDVATISGVSNEPSMDVYTGALIIVGVSAWLAFMLKRRDPIIWLVPVMIFIMLLPSALSIAFPGENPSHTRASGAIPLIFLITAFPLALLAEQLLDLLGKWRGRIAALVLCVVVVFASFEANSYLYFVVYRQLYNDAFHPYTDGGRYLLGYILTGGKYGNAFLIGYDHWWSHRAVGLEGGLEEFWPNGVYPREDLPAVIHSDFERTDKFRLDPDVDLIFFYSPDDLDTESYLQQLFPTGMSSEHRTRKPNETFMIFHVPALGEENWQVWLDKHPAQ